MLAGVLIVAALGVEAQAQQGVLNWFDKEVFKRVQITGYRRFGYTNYHVEGDREAYNLLNFYGQGGRRFTDIGQVNLSGRQVFGVLNFEMTLSDNRFQDPQSRKITLEYDRGPWSASAGDINGRLINTNRFATFFRPLRGAQVGYRSGPLQLRSLYSEARGSTKTVTIQGNNTTGPYYLGASQIVIGSEKVRVDDTDMRLGIDYVISYEIGTIQFVNRVVPPTSQIIVTFEELLINADRGVIQGLGASYDLGKVGRVGFTFIEQKTGGAGGLAERLEQFQGFGAAGTPYYLQFQPLPTRPIVIRVDAIVQTPELDYYFDTENPSVFYFRRFIPPTSTIDVTYTPRPTDTNAGDRRVIGLDYNIPLGRQGNVQLSAAQGRLSNAVSPLEGIAKGIDVNYRTGGLRVRGGIRDVPDGFVTVTSVGFNRNERAWDLGVDYAAAGGVRYEASHRNASISVRNTDAQGNVGFTSTRSVQSTGAVEWGSGERPDWRVSHQRTAYRTSLGETKTDSTDLSHRRRLGQVDLSFGARHLGGSGPMSTAEGVKLRNVTLDGVQLGANYAPGGLWTARAQAGVSQIRTEDKSGRGTDLSLAVVYDDAQRFAAQASFVISDSGAVAALSGFNPGYGAGLDGNGFTNGIGTSLNPSGAADLRLLQLGAQYRLTQRMGIDVALYRSRTSGSISSNTESTAWSVGYDYDIGLGHVLALGFNQTDTRFLGSDNRSLTRAFDSYFSGNPPGPWSYRAGYSLLKSSGNSLFQQDNVYWDLGVTYRIDPRQRLSASYTQGQASGYQPQRENALVFSYGYEIFRGISLVGNYRIRDVRNLDGTTAGQYRARGFDLELAFNFGR